MRTSDQEPEQLGPYALGEPLGEGGMGTVRRAVHTGTGAVHALKIVRPQTPEESLRFLREAEGMARVEGHPHVLRVHASGQEHGRLWLAMELAPGGTLEARLARGPLPVDDVAPLGRALALGLAHVHTRGVLHRDLKPANVLFDASGQPKLADFGVARVRGAQALTQTGAIIGTPAYMAPEQALSAGGVDERADVYGLGALLYHAATGRPPFQAASTIAMLEAVIRAQPVDPRRLRPELPAWVSRELLRALSKSPDERHPSASALAAALAGPGVTPRRRAPLALGALAVAAVGVAVVARGLGRPAVEPAAATPATVRSTRVAPSPQELERLLNEGDPERALELASGEPGNEARWVRFRALLLLGRASEAAALTPLPRERREVARALLALEAIRDDLVLVDRVLTAVRSTGERTPAAPVVEATEVRFENPFATLATRLDAIRSLEPPLARVRDEAGTAGQAVLARLVDPLAQLFPELLRLVRNEGGQHERAQVADVVETLRSVIAVVPDSQGRRSLETVTAWLGVAARPHEERAPADLAAIARAATDPGLEPRFRRLAALTMVELELRTTTALDALVELEERLGPTPGGGDPLIDAYRRSSLDLADKYLRRAWEDRAQRAAIVARLDRLLDGIPASDFHDTLGRLRLMSGLLSGREPSVAAVGTIRPGHVYRMIVEGEVLLGRGQWAEAAQRFRDAQERVGPNDTLVDPWTGLALALALAGDLDGAAATLAAAESRGTPYVWLPWRGVADTQAAIAQVRARTWAPSPGHPFPPD